MKSKTRQFLIAVFLLGSAPAMFAQNDGGGGGIKPYVSFGFNLAQGHGHDLTEKTWGGLGAFTGEAGLEFFHPYAGLSLRPNVGYAKILGEPLDTKAVYDLLAFYVGFDIIYAPIKKLPVSITLGPSFHSWSIELMNAPGNPVQGDKNMKLGWRFGVGYEVMDNLRVDLTFTQTEWRSVSTRPYVVGYNPSRPAYFTLKASYSF